MNWFTFTLPFVVCLSLVSAEISCEELESCTLCVSSESCRWYSSKTCVSKETQPLINETWSNAQNASCFRCAQMNGFCAWTPPFDFLFWKSTGPRSNCSQSTCQECTGTTCDWRDRREWGHGHMADTVAAGIVIVMLSCSCVSIMVCLLKINRRDRDAELCTHYDEL